MSCMLIRTFIIYHDCVHNSYTPNKYINYLLATITGIFVLTSPNWYIDHHIHHLTTGNINNSYKYAYNETIFHSVNEYSKFSYFIKIFYKFVRHPLLFFPLGSIFYFFIGQRFLFMFKSSTSNHVVMFNHIINNIGLGYLCYLCYQSQILYHYLLSYFISTIMGEIIFHNEHTFNPAYVINNEHNKEQEQWSIMNSGVKGSSFIQIPFYLKFFTNGIEYHHIHHINSKIPGYNLQAYHENSSNVFDNVNKLYMCDIYQNLWLVLYSEKYNKYVTFTEADQELDEKIDEDKKK